MTPSKSQKGLEKKGLGANIDGASSNESAVDKASIKSRILQHQTDKK